MMHFFANTPEWSLPNADPSASDTVLTGVMEGAFFLLGLLAVGFIIYSGVKFQLSRGNAGEMVKARNMLVFSVVGLILASSAWAIVRFVLRNLGS